MKPEKEKILVCLYAYYPFANANTNVAEPIINELAKHYEITLVTKNFDNSQKENEIVNGINIYRYRNQNKLIRKIQNIREIDKEKPRKIWKSWLINIFQPILRKTNSWSSIQHTEYKLIKKLLEYEKYSAIFSTCESYTSMANVLKLKKENKFKIPWINYFMDPHAYFIENLGSKNLIKQECEIYENSKLILVTEEIFEENKKNELSRFINKTIPINFGNFNLNQYKTKENSNKKQIKCVYTGSFISGKIRNPEYFFEIISRLGNEYIFHIACKSISSEINNIRNKILKKNTNILWYENLSMAESSNLIDSADILINIGNKTINQTPSKVFEYMSTGKPIINIHYLADDTSKKYLEKYPLSLNILENYQNINESVISFKKFCDLNKNNQVEKDILEKKVIAYSSDVAPIVAAKKIISAIECNE